MAARLRDPITRAAFRRWVGRGLPHRLTARLERRKAVMRRPQPWALTPQELAAVHSRVESGQLRARAGFVTALAAGADQNQAVVDTVRLMTRRRLDREAYLFAKAARTVPGLEAGGRAALGLTLLSRGRYLRAERSLAALPRDLVMRIAPAEYVAATFARDPVAAAALLEDLLQDPRSDLPSMAWLNLARTTFGRGRLDLCRHSAERVLATQPSRPEATEARWLLDWVSRATPTHREDAIAPGRVRFGVLDYKEPDLRQTSGNIGDYIQTLASLGHLVRHHDLRFHGNRALVAALDTLRDRVQPARRRHGIEGDVEVRLVNRDASSLDEVPPGTWMLAFGWYMHTWFKLHYDFPFHPNLLPIFVSFHLNRADAAASPTAIDYLRRHAPIGCRDWDTVHFLLDRDVPAFFSGCLTTTVDMLFPSAPPSPPKGAPIAFVDLPAGTEPKTRKPWFAIQHSAGRIRTAPFHINLDLAYRMLASYREDFSQVITSRLHCYLPNRALGVDVRFRPKNPADIRFDGLIGIDDAAFRAVQSSITEKIETVLTAILGGAGEVEVRDVWARICTEDVAEANARHGQRAASRASSPA